MKKNVKVSNDLMLAKNVILAKILRVMQEGYLFPMSLDIYRLEDDDKRVKTCLSIISDKKWTELTFIPSIEEMTLIKYYLEGKYRKLGKHLSIDVFNRWRKAAKLVDQLFEEFNSDELLRITATIKIKFLPAK